MIRRFYERGRLSRNDVGATAIEYALIGGLIGLGIVGALVTTKGSLNGTFGTASSQMAIDQNAPTAVPVPYNSTWSVKTLTSKNSSPPANSAVVTNLNYSDGSHVKYQPQFTKADGSIVPEFVGYRYDSRSLELTTYQSAYKVGNTTYDPVYTYTTFYGDGSTPERIYQVTIGSDGVSRSTQQTFNSRGQSTGYQTGQGSSSSFASISADAAYFSAYVPSITK